MDKKLHGEVFKIMHSIWLRRLDKMELFKLVKVTIVLLDSLRQQRDG